MGFKLDTRIPLTPDDRRRPEYVGGTPIVLPDGLPWRFFEPQPVVREVRGGEGEIERMICWEFGGEGVDAETNDMLGRGYHKILGKIHCAKNDRDRACGYLEAAWFLLARNYDVLIDEFEDILLSGGRYRTGSVKRASRSLRRLTDEACERMARLVDGLTIVARAEADDDGEAA